MAKNAIERLTGHWPRWAQQVRDQAGHFLMGMALGLIPALLGAPWWASLGSAVLGATIYEASQWPFERLWDTVLDWTFISAGGMGAAVLV